MNYQWKDHPDLQGPPKQNGSQQLQTQNVHTKHIENTYDTNKEGHWLFANKLLTLQQRTERIQQRNKGNTGSTTNWSKHPQAGKIEIEKHSHGIDWQQKSIRYRPPNDGY